MNKPFEVTFLGTNGSCAHSNGNRQKYGSNTSCVAVAAGDETLIFDTGSGICGFAGLEKYQRKHINIFYTHYHVDHIHGLLFSPFLFDTEISVDIYGFKAENMDVKSIVNNFLSSPFHPVGIMNFDAAVNFRDLTAGKSIALSNIVVHTHLLEHSSCGAVGYRVEYDGKAFVHCPDIELSLHKNDNNLLEFISNADLLVLDAFFDDSQVIEEWGHSSWKECTEWATRANAKKLALFHHRFINTDAEIDAMEAKAKKEFSGAFAAADFMKVEL